MTKTTVADLRDVRFIEIWHDVWYADGSVSEVVDRCNEEVGKGKIFPFYMDYSNVTALATKLRANNVPMELFPAGQRRRYINVALCQQAIAKATGTTAKKIRELAKKKRST